MDDEEKPLLVQLTWHRDDREGRFLLRKDRSSAAPLSVCSDDPTLVRKSATGS